MNRQPTNQPEAREDTGVNELVQGLSYFHPVSDEVAAYLKDHTVRCFAKKRELLLKEGAVCSYVYFIKKGVLRGFIQQGDKDITTWITAENELVTAIPSLNKQHPSREYIQAVEDCELLVMTYKDLEVLYEKHVEFNIVGRKLLQKYYEDAEERAFVVRLTKAEDRYQHFLNKYEHLANRIPIKHIASFLGITQETLSRVRQKGVTAGKRLPGNR